MVIISWWSFSKQHNAEYGFQEFTCYFCDILHHYSPPENDDYDFDDQFYRYFHN